MPLAFSKIFTIRNAVVDLMILACVYFIPALSHLAPFPVYLLDPMRVFMLLGYLLTRNNANAYLVAATISLFSALVTGHPPFFKAILISFELTANIFIFVQLLKWDKFHSAIALFVSIFMSKLFYYLMKFFFYQVRFGRRGFDQYLYSGSDRDYAVFDLHFLPFPDSFGPEHRKTGIAFPESKILIVNRLLN